MSSATIVTIKGKSYEFVNKDGKTALYFSARTTPRADRDKAIREVPLYWFITRKSGELLFALKPKIPFFKIIAAQSFYDNFKGQWFEPLADNYYELVWIHPHCGEAGSPQYAAYKHFSWKQIVDFIDNEDISIATDFLKNGNGDWKQSKKAGNHYLLCFIHGFPYWCDAVGQIPFAIWSYRNKSRSGADKEGAIKWVIGEGIAVATGKPQDIIKFNFDLSNEYDNFFVLRGALWASKRFSSTTTVSNTDYPAARVKVTINETSYSLLANSITQEQLTHYGIWHNE